MRTLIETYRGQDIYFDTDKESFVCVLVVAGIQKEKKSYASCKKEIDDYLKNNSAFKPFEVEPTLISMRYSQRYRIVGIRKDGRFMAENGKGEKVQIAESDEVIYMLIDPENAPLQAKINQLHAEFTRIYREIVEIKKKLKVVTLKDIKSKYLPQQ